MFISCKNDSPSLVVSEMLWSDHFSNLTLYIVHLREFNRIFKTSNPSVLFHNYFFIFYLIMKNSKCKWIFSDISIIQIKKSSFLLYVDIIWVFTCCTVALNKERVSRISKYFGLRLWFALTPTEPNRAPGSYSLRITANTTNNNNNYTFDCRFIP